MKSILVADDDRHMARTVCDILRRRDLHADAAGLDGPGPRVMKRRVLVGDDDRQRVYTIRAILDRRGWESSGAYSGEEAVAIARQEPPFAVLMDVRMPGISGVEACQAIQATRPETPIILMTAYAAPDQIAGARQSGALTVMPKPLAWPKLLAHLDRIPNGSSGAR